MASARPENSDQSLVRSLVPALNDPDVAVRLAAARAMQRLGSPAVPALLECLAEVDAEHRLAIVRTLGFMGRAARTALPVLTRFDDDAELADAAKGAANNIRFGPPIDWDRLCTRLGRWFLLIGVLLETGCVSLHWTGLLAQSTGTALPIAVAWAVLGGFVGAVLGAGLHGRLGVYVGANYLGMGGACAGACVGQLLAIGLGPLLRGLGSG